MVLFWLYWKRSFGFENKAWQVEVYLSNIRNEGKNAIVQHFLEKVKTVNEDELCKNWARSIKNGTEIFKNKIWKKNMQVSTFEIFFIANIG